MTTIESFDDLITKCPLAGEEVQCQTLLSDLSLARESSGEVFIHDVARENDNSYKRVMMLMNGAIRRIASDPCDNCPNRIKTNS